MGNAQSQQPAVNLAALPEQLNILFSHYPSLLTRRDMKLEPLVALIGASRFYCLGDTNQGLTPGPPWPLKTTKTPQNPGGVSAWPGFFRSVRASMGNKIMLNVNTTTSAFYNAGNLQDSLREFGLGSTYVLQGFVKGLRVKTTYMSKSKACIEKAKLANGPQAIPLEHIFTIRGLPFTDQLPHANNVFFEYYPANSTKAVEASVAAYWRTTHQINLTNNDIVVDCGKGGPTFLQARWSNERQMLPANQSPVSSMCSQIRTPSPGLIWSDMPAVYPAPTTNRS